MRAAVDARILRYIFSLAGMTVLIRIAGFVEKQVLAYYFGAGAELDAYFVALNVPMTLFFLVSGVASPILLPVLVRRSQSSDPAGLWGQFNAFGLTFLCALAVLTAGAMVFAVPLAGVLAPGFDESSKALCAQLLRMLLPASLMLGLIPLTTTALNAQKQFLVAPLAELALKAILIAMLVVWADRAGVKTAAWGTSLGSVAAMAIHIAVLRRRWSVRGAGLGFRDPDFRLVCVAMLAPGAGILASRLGSIVENAACSMLEPGAVTVLELARKLINMPVVVIPFACSTVLFTYFSERNPNDDGRTSGQLLGTGMRVMTFLFLPLTVLTMLLAEPIAALVYQRGSFDPAATALTARVLVWLAPSMFFLAIETLLMRYFFAHEHFWSPIAIGMMCVAAKVAIIVAGVGTYGIAAIAGAIVVTRALKIAVLLLVMRRRIQFSAAFLQIGELAKICAASAVAAVAVLAVLRLIQPAASAGLTGRLLQSAAGSCAMLVVYLAGSHVLGLRDYWYAVERWVWRQT